MAERGMVFLLGGGPGDPELITERARRRLGEADLVLYDALIHPELLTLARPGAELQFVGKRAGRASERQGEINRRMVEAALAGRRVARLKGGDPYLFGRGSEEAEALAAAGIAFEVVPGVPSPLSATAYAGISLSHRELASSIAYVTATESPDKDQSIHDWSKLATATQTLVIFMGRRRLAALMQTLMDHGRAPDCPAAVIASASLPSQRTVVATVATLAHEVEAADLGTPALTVVGEVVRLRERLRWYDNKPLFGKRVLLTRPRAQAEAMVRALRDAGAEPLCVPAIAIEPAPDTAALSDAVARAAEHDWIAFTSANAVAAFFDELERSQRDARSLGGVGLAAIGKATAQALRDRGLRPDLTPQAQRGEGLAAALIAAHGGTLEGVRVLLPRAERAREALAEALVAAGAQLFVVAAYRTVAADADDLAQLRTLIEAGELDVVTFTSGSTVEHTLAALGPAGPQLLAKITLASIGEVTTEAATRLGLSIDITAEDTSAEGLVAALKAHFQSD
ncbi:MAG: uroporphyrinogen-III C-methyltransferase [Myxococcales bacterium]|nr:uroporphyrinogen-III C-methyltransferase [Myxococcales bacterium]